MNSPTDSGRSISELEIAPRLEDQGWAGDFAAMLK